VPVDIKKFFNVSQGKLDVDINEFSQALHLHVSKLRASLSTVQLQQLFKKIDTDKNGTISYTELYDFINPKKNKKN
jgi:Ca2+-binding EF-hand superfamily protein